jgi:urocanate hydratase
MGLSIHAGLAVVVDGTEDARAKAVRCLTGDPGLGVARHADAGYAQAIDAAQRDRVRIPMLRDPS